MFTTKIEKKSQSLLLFLVFKFYMSFLCVHYIDRFTQHRYKVDQAFELDGNKSPVAQYLDINTIVEICAKNGVQGT